MKTVKVIIDLCVVPIGVGVNLAPYIAACERVRLEAGLKIQLHPNGTVIEGEWAPVFTAIEACHTAVHDMGAPRIHTTVKVNTRTDRHQTLEDKVVSVQALLQLLTEERPVSGALRLRRSQGLEPVAGLGLALPWSRPPPIRKAFLPVPSVRFNALHRQGKGRRRKDIPQLRLRDVQGTTMRDERCSRLDLIG